MKKGFALGPVVALAVALVACQENPGAKNPAAAGSPVQAGSPSRCNVQGVWSLDSVVADGKVEPQSGRKQMKIIAASHYSWISQQGGQMPLRTMSDSLAAYRTRGSGGGSYRLTDSSYVERLDLFYDPREVGREVEITCRVAGNRWDASYDWPLDENGKRRTVHVQEIWRRVE